MRQRFFWAIFGVAAGVIVLLLVSAAGLTRLATARATTAELERTARAVAEVLAERIDDGAADRLLRGGEGLTGLEDIRRAVGGSHLALFAVGPDGSVRGAPLVRSVGVDGSAIYAGETQQLRFRDDAGRQVQALAYPVGTVGPGDRLMLGVLVARAVPVQAPLPRWMVLLPLAAAALAAAAAAGWLARTLSRRLGSVAEASRRLSAGDLSARAAVEGDDELSEVAHAFNQMAARLAEAKAREREFLLAVGHDLRTPLTTISGYAEALADAAADPDDTRRIAEVLEGETTRLRRLIEDVMLLARLDSAEFTLRPEPVDVAAHLNEVLEGFRPRAERARVRLAADLEAGGLRIVDPDRLAQVVGNLVENALRYTPEAGEVRVTARVEGERLEVEVSDTGPGIDAEDLPRIFERFYVARKYRGVRPEGSGLGLSIVQRLVAAMGGEVSADSTPGEGTTVRVVLPAPAATPTAADRRDSAVP